MFKKHRSNLAQDTSPVGEAATVVQQLPVTHILKLTKKNNFYSHVRN